MRKSSGILFSLLLIALVPASADDAAGIYGLSAGQWREDIETLRERAPQVHANLYHTLPEKDWNSRLDALSARVDSLPPRRIVLELAKIVSAISDGHTEIYFGVHNPVLRFQQIPLRFYRFEEGVYLQAATSDHSLAVGRRVLSIGGTQVETVISSIQSYLPRDNPYYLDTYATVQTLNNFDVLQTLGYAGEDSVTVAVDLPGDEVFTFMVAPVDSSHGLAKWSLEPDRDALGEGWAYALPQSCMDESLRLRTPSQPFRLDWDEEKGHIYLDVNQIRDSQDESFAAVARRLEGVIAEYDVNRVIIDLRDNGGGNNQLNQPLVHALIRSPSIDRPDRLFVLIGRHTFSAASHLVTAIETHTQATFVGMPTGASPNHYGDADAVILPNSRLRVMLSSYYWQNSWPWDHRQWTAPDLAAPLAFAAYRDCQDPAIAVIETHGDRPTLLQAVAPLESREKIADVIGRYAADPVYRFVNVEGSINRRGYDLLGRGQALLAAAVFGANTDVFSQSANAFDSLGEALVAADRKDEAIAAYRRAVDLDPDGRIGANARERLQQLVGN